MRALVGVALFFCVNISKRFFTCLLSVSLHVCRLRARRRAGVRASKREGKSDRERERERDQGENAEAEEMHREVLGSAKLGARGRASRNADNR